MNKTAFRIDSEPATLTGIAVSILRHHSMDRRPTADVAPAKLTFENQNLAFSAGIFHHRIIDRQVRHLIVFVGNSFTQPRSRTRERTRPRRLLDFFQRFINLRLVSLQCSEECGRLPNEDPAVPDRKSTRLNSSHGYIS